MPALIRWNPNRTVAPRTYFRPFRLLEEAEAMARQAFDATNPFSVDMFEEEKDVIVKAELPGIKKTDLDIQLNDNVLTIKAEKKDEKVEGKEGTKHYYRERTFGQYVRTIALPSRVDAEAVKATLKSGLLEIRLPKAADPEHKKIQISTK